MKHHYKTVCISDVHLGTRQTQAKHLFEFLDKITTENLFLVGDIIHYHDKASYKNLIEKS